MKSRFFLGGGNVHLCRIMQLHPFKSEHTHVHFALYTASPCQVNKCCKYYKVIFLISKCLCIYYYILIYSELCKKKNPSRRDCQCQWFKKPYSNRQSTHTHIQTYKVIEMKNILYFQKPVLTAVFKTTPCAFSFHTAGPLHLAGFSVMQHVCSI